MIAILVDSGCDVPQEILEQKNVYVVPLTINYKNRSYRDGIDITAKEIYQTLDNEVPSTSLPSGEEIKNILDKIKNDGFDEVLAITISSQLSGTYNIIRIVGEDENIKIKVVDSKNISIGAGFLAVLAYDLSKKELDVDEIFEKVSNSIYENSVFFCLDTLKYLQRGGRIGTISAFFGTKLNLKPVISCNKDGVYYNMCKARGKKQAILKIIEFAKEFIKDAKKYNICISHGGAESEFETFIQVVSNEFTTAQKIYLSEISPTLCVHTGPGLLGIGVSIIE